MPAPSCSMCTVVRCSSAALARRRPACSVCCALLSSCASVLLLERHVVTRHVVAMAPQACLTCTGVVIFTGVGKSGLISQVGVGGRCTADMCAPWCTCQSRHACIMASQHGSCIVGRSTSAATSACHVLRASNMWLARPLAAAPAAEDLPDPGVHRHQGSVPQPARCAGEGRSVSRRQHAASYPTCLGQACCVLPVLLPCHGRGHVAAWYHGMPGRAMPLPATSMPVL